MITLGRISTSSKQYLGYVNSLDSIVTDLIECTQIGAMAKPETPPDISPEAEDFLKKTFEFDYKLRPSAAELLQHPMLMSD